MYLSQIDPNSMCDIDFHYPTAWQSATKSQRGYPLARLNVSENEHVSCLSLEA